MVTLEFKSTLRLMELIDNRWGRQTQTDSQVSHQAAQVKHLHTIRAGEENQRDRECEVKDNELIQLIHRRNN